MAERSPGECSDFESRLTELQREMAGVRAENMRLRAMLGRAEDREPLALHQSDVVGASGTPVSAGVPPEHFATGEKIAIFRRLFKGRSDVYAVRWESRTTGKSGYSPACGNEWKPGVCGKPRIKCADCPNRLFLPLTDQVIFDHLAGKHTVGVYPLLSDDTCHFLAVDLDEAEWRDDARSLRQSCKELNIPVALEVSRSGKGAHLWVFFSQSIPARTARQLGSAIISYTCSELRQLKLSSYDRLFPNQDTLPKGGFGNLIALPLQKVPRERGFSTFVDGKLLPYSDQWAFLASLKVLSPAEAEDAIRRATAGGHPLDVAFLAEDESENPWKRVAEPPTKLPGPLPASLNVTVADQLYFEKAALPQPLTNRLIRLAAFPNPEFYQKQAMRFSVWNIPRIISCAENFPKHIALPRGCLEAVTALLKGNQISLNLQVRRGNLWAD